MGTSNKRSTAADFVGKARIIHGANKYAYDRVCYRNNRTPVEIVCLTHGPFLQAPTNHLRGKGCRKCASHELAKIFRKTSDEFVKRAITVHGNRYDYSKVAYMQARQSVEILCRSHGSFWQVPFVHLRGGGCPKCKNEASSERQRSTTGGFTSLARKRFGSKFDYSLVA